LEVFGGTCNGWGMEESGVFLYIHFSYSFVVKPLLQFFLEVEWRLNYFSYGEMLTFGGKSIFFITPQPHRISKLSIERSIEQLILSRYMVKKFFSEELGVGEV
jgi:hypothetical protein